MAERMAIIHIMRMTVETEDYKDGRSCCFTSMHFDWERGAFTIEGAAGQTDLIPEFPGIIQWNCVE